MQDIARRDFLGRMRGAGEPVIKGKGKSKKLFTTEARKL